MECAKKDHQVPVCVERETSQVTWDLPFTCWPWRHTSLSHTTTTSGFFLLISTYQLNDWLTYFQSQPFRLFSKNHRQVEEQVFWLILDVSSMGNDEVGQHVRLKCAWAGGKKRERAVRYAETLSRSRNKKKPLVISSYHARSVEYELWNVSGHKIENDWHTHISQVRYGQVHRRKSQRYCWLENQR